MRLPRLRTIQQKLLAVVLLTTLVALIVALCAIAAYNLRAHHDNVIFDMSTQAELLGHMTAPALAFQDKDLATQNLRMLEVRPQVLAGAIYSLHDGIVATYTAPGVNLPFPPSPEPDSIRTEGQDLIVFKNLFSGGEAVGTVYLRADYGIIDR